MGSLQVLRAPPTDQRHAASGVMLTDYSKLPTGVNVSVNACVAHCVSPATD